MKNIKGFTLIELLVVVFIVGILSAVALPQYQRVITKTRIAAMMPMMDAVIKGQQIYKVTWRRYADFNTQAGDSIPLDIKLPLDTNKYVLTCRYLPFNEFMQGLQEAGNTEEYNKWEGRQSDYKTGFCQLKLLVKEDGKNALGPILEYALPGMNSGLDFSGQSNAFSRMCLARKDNETEQWACKSLTGASDHISNSSENHWYYKFQ